VSYRKDGKIVHNALRPQLHTEELDALPFATDIYKRDLEIERYNVPFLLHPYVSFSHARIRRFARSAMWPQTIWGCVANAFDGKRGAGSEADDRTTSQMKRDFLRRRHLQHPQDALLELCAKSNR